MTDEEALHRLCQSEEGQYFDRKSLFEGPPGQKKARDRKAVRDEVAEYVAAFANADGGTLVLGVEDDGTVTGCPYADEQALQALLSTPEGRVEPPQPRGRMAQVEGKAVVVFEVPAAPRAVMVRGDGFPRREGDQVIQSSEVLINRIKDGGMLAGPESRVTGAPLGALSLEAVQAAALAGGFSGTAEQYLAARKLADWRGSELVLRQGAVWLFANSPEAIEHPNAGIRVFRVHGTSQTTGDQRNVQDVAWVEGNLVAVLEQAHAKISTMIRSSSRLHDLFFRETPEYPPFAWQEALVNALAHRDYSIESRCIEVWLYDDRMEVRSPGGLLPEVTLEALLERKRVHASRNPRVARVLTELGVMRQQGEGIPRMIEEMELSWLPAPGIDVSDREFVVTLRNEPIFGTTDRDWAKHVRGLPLQVRQKRALAAFGDRQSFQSSDYQELNRVDRDVAYTELRELEQLGLLRGSGVTKGRRYVVVKSPPGPAKEPTPLERLVARMRSAGRITNSDYREAFSVGREPARAALSAWVAAGVVELRGERRGAHYVPGPAWPPR